MRAKDTSLCMHVLCLGWGKGATTNFAGWTCDRWPVTKAQHGDVLLWDNVYSSAQNDCVHHETLFCHGMANDQDPTRRRFQSHPTLQPTRCDCECVGPCFFFCFEALNEGIFYRNIYKNEFCFYSMLSFERMIEVVCADENALERKCWFTDRASLLRLGESAFSSSYDSSNTSLSFQKADLH